MPVVLVTSDPSDPDLLAQSVDLPLIHSDTAPPPPPFTQNPFSNSKATSCVQHGRRPDVFFSYRRQRIASFYSCCYVVVGSSLNRLRNWDPPGRSRRMPVFRISFFSFITVLYK